jgi:hypothetical protein
MGGGYIVIINTAGITVCPVFMLATGKITVLCRCTGMRTGFGISALRTGIAAEGVIAPPGIPVAFHFFPASVTGCVVAVHIAVFIGIYRFCAAVLAVITGSTFPVGIECVIQPARISVAFGDGTALRAF